MTFGTKENYRTENIVFDVVDIAMPYNGILGRPALAKFMAVVHHAYNSLKIPSYWGVMTGTTNAGDAVACVRQVYKEIAAASAQKNGGGIHRRAGRRGLPLGMRASGRSPRVRIPKNPGLTKELRWHRKRLDIRLSSVSNPPTRASLKYASIYNRGAVKSHPEEDGSQSERLPSRELRRRRGLPRV